MLTKSFQGVLFVEVYSQFGFESFRRQEGRNLSLSRFVKTSFQARDRSRASQEKQVVFTHIHAPK